MQYDYIINQEFYVVQKEELLRECYKNIKNILHYAKSIEIIDTNNI